MKMLALYFFRVKLAIGLGLALGSISTAGDWPIFRGPDLNGISKEAGLSGEGKAEIIWNAELGLGYSAPVIADGRVIVSGHDGKATDTLFCLDEATGEIKWKHSYPQPLADLYFQGGTTGTATIDSDHVFHVARQGELVCLEAATGKIVWKKHLQDDFGYTMPTWGFTGAPLVQGGVLYVTAGESGLALKKADGSEIWKSEDEEAGYSAPYPFDKNGKSLMIFSNKRAYVCVEPDTGKVVWEYRWMTRYGVNAADPIVTGDYIFISSGYGKGAVLAKWTGEGDPERVWQNRDMKTQMNAAVLVNGHLYGVDGNESQDGTGLKCLDLMTGETKWSEEGVAHGTMTVVANQLLVLTEQGRLEIAKVSPDGYQPTLSQQVLKPRVWTVPVFANGRIFARNAGGEFIALEVK